MGIVNKRNAVLGWLTWKVGKGMAKRKAKGAVPHAHHHHGRKKPAFLAGIAAALGGAFWFLRKGKGGHEHSGPE